MSGRKEARIPPPPPKTPKSKGTINAYELFTGTSIVLSLALKGSISITSKSMASTLDLFKGTIRLSKKFYDKLQDQIDERIKREIEKMEIAFSQVLKFNKNKGSENAKLALTSYEDKLSQKVNNIDLLIEHLKNRKEFRKKVEEDKNLRNDLSKQIQKQIDELIKKKKELEEKQKQYRKTKNSKEDKVRQKTQDLIYKCTLLSKIYPDWAEETIAILNQRGLNNRILRAKEKEINDKLNYLNDQLIKEKLLKLSHLRKKFETIPFLFRLSNNERRKFYAKLTDMIQKVEFGVFNNQEIEELEVYVEELRKKATEIDKKIRFEEATDKAGQALSNRGYSFIKTKDSGYYMELEGTKTDGKRAKVKVLKPEAKDNMSPMIIEIDQKGYKDSEKWEKEGKELAWELESLGVIIDFEETSTHFKGKLLQNAAQLLKRKIEQETPASPVEVKIEGQDIVTIVYKNGSQKQIEWKENMSLNNIISKLEERYSEETVQKKALLEEEL